MDFIERWFHVSPDGGNGALEAAYIAVAVGVVVLVIARRRVLSFGQRCMGRLPAGPGRKRDEV